MSADLWRAALRVAALMSGIAAAALVVLATTTAVDREIDEARRKLAETIAAPKRPKGRRWRADAGRKR